MRLISTPFETLSLFNSAKTPQMTHVGVQKCRVSLPKGQDATLYLFHAYTGGLAHDFPVFFVLPSCLEPFWPLSFMFFQSLAWKVSSFVVAVHSSVVQCKWYFVILLQEGVSLIVSLRRVMLIYSFGNFAVFEANEFCSAEKTLLLS